MRTRYLKAIGGAGAGGVRKQLLRPADLRQFEIPSAASTPTGTSAAAAFPTPAGPGKPDVAAFRERSSEKDDYSELLGGRSAGTSTVHLADSLRALTLWKERAFLGAPQAARPHRSSSGWPSRYMPA